MQKNRARKPQRIHVPAALPAPAAPAAAMLMPLGYDPTGKIEQRDIVSLKDGWSEYTLNDGTVIRAKAVVLDVKKAIDQYDAQGDPIYLLQLAFVNTAVVPQNLKKKKKS